MKGISFVVFLAMTLTLILLPRQAAAVEVTLILRNITTADFDEWKVRSSEKCTQCTGKIRQDTRRLSRLGKWVIQDTISSFGGVV